MAMEVTNYYYFLKSWTWEKASQKFYIRVCWNRMVVSSFHDFRKDLTINAANLPKRLYNNRRTRRIEVHVTSFFGGRAEDYY